MLFILVPGWFLWLLYDFLTLTWQFCNFCNKSHTPQKVPVPYKPQPCKEFDCSGWRIKQNREKLFVNFLSSRTKMIHTTHESTRIWKYNDSESTLATHVWKKTTTLNLFIRLVKKNPTTMNRLSCDSCPSVPTSAPTTKSLSRLMCEIFSVLLLAIPKGIILRPQLEAFTTIALSKRCCCPTYM